ncbi:MAG: dTDP-4-dehydrorhamnose reductase [Candidatus Udaeobacter sp.]
MKIVVLGAGGRLGAALMREFRPKCEVVGFNHAQLDLSNLESVREELGATSFDVLINAAAFTNVDACETERDRAFRINAEAPRVLAETCNEKHAKLIHFSTDYVFDGEKRAPYTEEDQANPISAYGESKLAGENSVLAAGDEHLVVRVSWVFGPDRPSFVDAMIKRAQQDQKIDAISDKFSTPTYTHDIANMLPEFFDRGVAGGVLHFANAGKCTWQEYAQWALDCCRDAGISLKGATVGALKLSEMTRLPQGSGGRAPWIARRPIYSVLSTAKYEQLTGTPPRTWRAAVADYITRSYSKK